MYRITHSLPVFFLFAELAWAQTASLGGTVHDQAGAAVPEVIVTAKSLNTQVNLQTLTNQAGYYEFPALRPGTYSVKAERPGFRITQQSSIGVAVDQRPRVDPILVVGDTTSTVDVNAEVSGVQTESSAIGEVIDSKRISDIPLNGRFFLDLALLVPGTVMGRRIAGPAPPPQALLVRSASTARAQGLIRRDFSSTEST